MRIAFLTPEYPHRLLKSGGGLGTSIHNLARALINKGIGVSVIVIGQKIDEEFSEDGIDFYIFKQRKYKAFGFYFYRKYIGKCINEIIERQSIDLIEAPDWTGITAFMNIKVPLVIRFHGSDAYFSNLEGRKQKLKNFWFEKLGLQKASAFIAPTDFAGKLTKTIFNIDGEVTTIHNGLNVQDFENEFPEEFENGMILYIGTLIRKKGVLELPEIFKRVVASYPKAQLVLIGADSFDIQTQSDSTLKLLLEAVDEDIRDKVHYLGKISYQEVKEHIKKANVCIFPTYAETFGMVTVEAMALQKAVVNSNIGWANELIVDGESGLLTYPADHQEYAERIVELLQNKALALHLGKKARERVEIFFDVNSLVVENINFYKNLL